MTEAEERLSALKAEVANNITGIVLALYKVPHDDVVDAAAVGRNNAAGKGYTKAVGVQLSRLVEEVRGAMLADLLEALVGPEYRGPFAIGVQTGTECMVVPHSHSAGAGAPLTDHRLVN